MSDVLEFVLDRCKDMWKTFENSFWAMRRCGIMWNDVEFSWGLVAFSFSASALQRRMDSLAKMDEESSGRTGGTSSFHLFSFPSIEWIQWSDLCSIRWSLFLLFDRSPNSRAVVVELLLHQASWNQFCQTPKGRLQDMTTWAFWFLLGEQIQICKQQACKGGFSLFE